MESHNAASIRVRLNVPRTNSTAEQAARKREPAIVENRTIRPASPSECIRAAAYHKIRPPSSAAAGKRLNRPSARFNPANRNNASLPPAIRAAAEQLQGEYYGEHIRYDHDEPDSLEEKLDDLKSLFVIHLRGEYDLNLCHGVIFALYSLEKDIKQHNRIRNRILRPIADAMLKACHDKE